MPLTERNPEPNNCVVCDKDISEDTEFCRVCQKKEDQAAFENNMNEWLNESRMMLDDDDRWTCPTCGESYELNYCSECEDDEEL